MTAFDDVTLMAYADGTLPADQAAAVAGAVAADPALADKVQAFRAARQAVAAIPAPPVPAALEARIRVLAAGQAPQPSPEDRVRAMAAAQSTPALAPPAPAENVVAFAPRPKRPVWHIPLAAAASLVAGLFLAPLLMPQSGTDGLPASLQTALTTLPSGQARDGVEIITSFQDGSGAFCREYEQAQPDQTMIGIACRDGETWHLRLAIATSAAEGYVPASSLDLLDAWLSENGAGQPMTAEEEAAVLAGR